MDFQCHVFFLCFCIVKTVGHFFTFFILSDEVFEWHLKWKLRATRVNFLWQQKSYKISNLLCTCICNLRISKSPPSPISLSSESLGLGGREDIIVGGAGKSPTISSFIQIKSSPHLPGYRYFQNSDQLLATFSSGFLWTPATTTANVIAANRDPCRVDVWRPLWKNGLHRSLVCPMPRRYKFPTDTLSVSTCLCFIKNESTLRWKKSHQLRVHFHQGMTFVPFRQWCFLMFPFSLKSLYEACFGPLPR